MEYMSVRGAVKHVNGAACNVFEYSTNDSGINIAVAVINGRYPESGAASNTTATELAYVISGEGIVSVEGVVEQVKEGDVVLIEPNEKFYWEGELKLSMSCSPAWEPSQYVHHL